MTSRRVERRAAGAGGAAETLDDAVAIEEPLEIRVDGETVAITMRTPGDDARLALGFLYGEGIIASLADVGTVAHCGRPGDEGWGNVLDVRSGPGVTLDVERVLDSRRWSVTSSACGVCGRRSIADLVERCPRLDGGPRLDASAIARAIDALAASQPNFARTGGIHAAAAFDAAGALLACHEDVGRHNAVDKTIGALLYAARLKDASLLAVSGRSSFEIVQKAAAARIPIVASVSAASSLAIDLAESAGLTLAGFVRGGSLNVYTHPERLL
ncbi:MAG TPA: formate dehydrogenase accessory sulfurtransferase FdhD [Polyangia bacterium]|nr:formate dehydrogenase accessory sulfurtransferase FdhD [Polyangia bacterium]